MNHHEEKWANKCKSCLFWDASSREAVMGGRGPTEIRDFWRRSKQNFELYSIQKTMGYRLITVADEKTLLQAVEGRFCQKFD